MTDHVLALSPRRPVEDDGRGDMVSPAALKARAVWTDPYDDGDPHYLPEAELVEPVRVPGWAYRAPGSAK